MLCIVDGEDKLVVSFLYQVIYKAREETPRLFRRNKMVEPHLQIYWLSVKFNYELNFETLAENNEGKIMTFSKINDLLFFIFNLYFIIYILM